MKVVQVGTNRAYDDLSNYLLSNYDELEFALFVEPFGLHMDSIKSCYSKYDNIIIENVAIKTPMQKQNDLTLYYHTNEHPNYEITTCNLEHLESHMSWCPHLQGGEVKSFTAQCITLEELFTKYNIFELDLLCLDVEGIDAEILLTFDIEKYRIKRIEFEHLHLGPYRDAVKNMMLGLGYKQLEPLSSYDWRFEKEFIHETKKLENLPSVNVVTIAESVERRKVLYKEFKKYGIKNWYLHCFEKYKAEDHKVISEDVTNFGIDINNLGPQTSHLKAIKTWYESTDDECAIFFEDDISFDTVKYWNFNWNEFYSSLPENWECIQLCVLQSSRHTIEHFLNKSKITPRDWSDWSCCAYLIKRSHAKKLIDNYYPDDVFLLDYKGWDREIRPQYNYTFNSPVVETIVYTLFEDTKDNQTVYAFPLFVENIEFNCSWGDILKNYSNDEDADHNFTRKMTLDWWKNKGSKLKLTK